MPPKKIPETRKLTADELLQEIVEIMAETDDETILEVANSIFADHPFTLTEDGMFEQKLK